ncbi:hypothetical protein DMA12_12725 [Amycolatopsis balhimycina DSM 5908]|uniref:Uncharacterized protein n=1 Tax=Amycolatopsis balhimycina DSM 5908 TaxID=1081091 RepID=A0A428WRS8_AMYBA|nr:hypothetical protein [Amycolatopsis balhimycina]RSM45738.1 hypothetical protein DMA12_12725 [Amycolatopsis balhimycina DSM 5908]
MAPRVSLPGELFLDAIVSYPERQLDVGFDVDDKDYGRRVPFDEATRERVKRRAPYVALRWVLNPALGIPLEPFTVWRRPARKREAAQPIGGWHQTGFGTFEWDGVTELLRIEIDLTASATITGLHRSDLDPVQSAGGKAGDTVVLDAGPMLGVRTDNPGAIGAARGLSLVTMANGNGWQPFEIVGLPLTPDQLNATYYGGAQQGPIGALTDPFEAAVRRLERWGPVLGWLPLAGLAPWVPPNAKPLVEEMQGDLLTGLVQVLAAHPPPAVGAQVGAAIVHKLEQLGQVIGARTKVLNSGAAGDRAEITVRPLQALTTSVATDTWASLALGFGTGDSLDGDDKDGGHDYMVTAPWDGILKTAVQEPWPFPWLPGAPPPVIIEEEVSRELTAIVLSPGLRPAPGVPSPLTAGLGHDEGANAVDEPYHASVVLQAARPPALPREPRAAAYALARYGDPGAGRYQLRKHPLAGGWVPIGSAVPVPEPGTPPDPRTPPNTVTLRNSGVERPKTGPAHTYEYYAAATDLFGQWSAWATTWCALGAAGVQAPAVATVKARAAGAADPCVLTVATEVVWDIRERSLHRLTLAVDAYPPTPPPPAAYDRPPETPQGGAVTLTTVTLSFATDGTPGAPPAGVDIALVHDDGTPVDAAHPADPVERRYRITLHDLPVTFAGRHELAVAVYARAEETIRPGEWSSWAHTREAAIAANPIPPPPSAPLPAVYPYWASLPDAAGLSYATVSWTPFGAWRYRVYEATEAALRAACGQPGPVLTDGFTARMQALFDLYRVAANLPNLKKAFRKLGTEPVLPPIIDGKMHFQSLLPRGSSLIHCYVVVGVTESNVISGWPQPDANGRKAFDGYAIPRPLRPAMPQLRATLDGAGVPQVTVRLEGAEPPAQIRLYRAANAILARSTGTMQLVATVPPASGAPGAWKQTTIPDSGAPAGWSRLQYRAVALATDDPERAGMAVPSEASRAYALLNPPQNPPTLTLTPNVEGTTDTASLVRVDTGALRKGSDVGDFAIAYTANPGPVRFASSLGTVPEFATTAALAADTEDAGYVGGVLHLRLPRAAGQELALAVDVTDPLARSTHGVLTIAAEVPDPAPVVTLAATRFGGIARLRIDTNVPRPPNPAHDWMLTVATQRLFNFPPSPPSTQTFSVSAIATIPNEAAMPSPAFDPALFEIRRIDGTSHIVMWLRAAAGIRVGVRLANADGQIDTATQVLA